MLDQNSSSDILKAGGVSHGGFFVAGEVARERFHVAFGVHAIVEAPVGDRGCDDGEGESVAVELDYFRGEVAAVGPSHDSHLLCVDEGVFLGVPLGGVDLIEGL